MRLNYRQGPYANCMYIYVLSGNCVARISYVIISHFVLLITFNLTVVCNDVMNM